MFFIHLLAERLLCKTLKWKRFGGVGGWIGSQDVVWLCSVLAVLMVHTQVTGFCGFAEVSARPVRLWPGSWSPFCGWQCVLQVDINSDSSMLVFVSCFLLSLISVWLIRLSCIWLDHFSSTVNPHHFCLNTQIILTSTSFLSFSAVVVRVHPSLFLNLWLIILFLKSFKPVCVTWSNFHAISFPLLLLHMSLNRESSDWCLLVAGNRMVSAGRAHVSDQCLSSHQVKMWSIWPVI